MSRRGLCSQLLFLFCLFGAGPSYGALIQDLELRLQQTQYLGEIEGDPEKSQTYSDVIGRLNVDFQDEDSQFKMQAGGVYGVEGSNESHLVIPELFLDRTFGDPRWSLTLGRHLFPWSRTDEVWGLSLFQPHFLWDSIQPEPQGLPGLFVKFNGNRFRTMGFASPLFLPDQGPGFDVEEGKIVSSNRWFVSPVERVRLSNSTSELSFRIERPSVDKVMNQSSWGYWAEWGQPKRGPFLTAAYAQKPMNSFHLAVDGNLSIAQNSGFPSTARVHPVLVRHEVKSLDVGWRWPDVESFVSYTQDRPQRPNLPEDWLEASLNDADIFSAGAKGQSFLLGYNHLWKFHYLSVHDVVNGNESSQLVSSKDVEGLDRFRFRHAWQSVLKTKWWDRRGEQLFAGLSHTYAFDEKGSLLSLEMSYHFEKTWTLNLTADVLGTTDDKTSGFITRHRANDRVRLGASYVF